MRPSRFLCLLTLLLSAIALAQSNPAPPINQSARIASPTTASQADPKAQAMILDGYGKLPLSFEANQGQTDAEVKFLSRGAGYRLFLTADEAVFSMHGGKPKHDRANTGQPARAQ